MRKDLPVIIWTSVSALLHSENGKQLFRPLRRYCICFHQIHLTAQLSSDIEVRRECASVCLLLSSHVEFSKERTATLLQALLARSASDSVLSPAEWQLTGKMASRLSIEQHHQLFLAINRLWDADADVLGAALVSLAPIAEQADRPSLELTSIVDRSAHSSNANVRKRAAFLLRYRVPFVSFAFSSI